MYQNLFFSPQSKQPFLEKRAQQEGGSAPSDAAKLQRRRRLEGAIGGTGGALAGYLMSRYGLGIKDLPSNLVFSGLGAGAGVLGSEILHATREKVQADEEVVADTVEDLRQDLKGGALEYHTRPRSLLFGKIPAAAAGYVIGPKLAAGSKNMVFGRPSKSVPLGTAFAEGSRNVPWFKGHKLQRSMLAIMAALAVASAEEGARRLKRGAVSAADKRTQLEAGGE